MMPVWNNTKHDDYTYYKFEFLNRIDLHFTLQMKVRHSSFLQSKQEKRHLSTSLIFPPI